jgi:hypothetical protein
MEEIICALTSKIPNLERNEKANANIKTKKRLESETSAIDLNIENFSKPLVLDRVYLQIRVFQAFQ